MNAFIESIQTILKDSVAKMTEEARKFTLVVTTLSRFPHSSAVTASSASSASSAIPTASPVGATTTAASATLDQRVRVLETTILDRTQKMLHGVMEDISELHSRVDKIQNPTPSWDNDNEEFPIPWFDRPPFTFQTPRNEIVHETPVENIRTLHVNPSVLHLPEPVEEPDGPPEEVEEVKVEEVKVEEKKVEEKRVEEKKVEEVKVEEVKVEEKKANEPEQVVEEEVVEEEVVEEEVVEEEVVEEEKKAVEAETDEEGEEEELEDFQHQGKLYYRDKDNNVYVEDEEGDIDSTPVGRWIQAKNTIKFFPK